MADLQALHAAPPAVTILKPVKGDEPGLYENLASLAAQDHPEFEMLIGAQDPRGPASGSSPTCSPARAAEPARSSTTCT